MQLGLAIPFYKGAIGSIRGGLANMDVLVSTLVRWRFISIRSLCCFIISQWGMMVHLMFILKHQ